MPRGDESKYTGQRECEPDHIAEGYEKRPASAKKAAATRNAEHHAHS